MPPEPFPWDRKDFFKERKHERSSESLGSVSRWRETPHHGSSSSSREFYRWGHQAEFRSRPPGHGKQGGSHMFSEVSSHRFMPSRSNEKILDEEAIRPSGYRSDGKHSRNSRENRASFSQKDWKGQSWGNRPHAVNDQRSVDDMPTGNSLPHSDFVNTCDNVHYKDRHDDKVGGVNGFGTGQRSERENPPGLNDWKPMKWTRSGSLSSRGSGFSNSSSSKSLGGVDSNEGKAEAQPSNATPMHSPSGDALACVTSAAPLEEMTSRKKPRLGWGEGLAKYEKKKVDGPVVESSTKNGMTVSGSSEPLHSYVSGFTDKSPRVTGFSDCASPATPSSVACSSSPGTEDKPFFKAVSIDNDTINLSGSSNMVSQNLQEGLVFNLENLEPTPIANLSTLLSELVQSIDPSYVDSSFVGSTAMKKLQVWKTDISKILETTESEIDLLENELKSLRAESENSRSCLGSSGSLPDQCRAKVCEEQGALCNFIPRPPRLRLVSCGDMIVENKVDALEEKHTEVKDNDNDSPGTVTSKLVAPLSSENNATGYINPEVKCSMYGSNQEGAVSSVASLHSEKEDELCNLVLACNKDIASKTSLVFNKLLPTDPCNIDISRATCVPCWQNNPLTKEKFAAGKRFLRFKERVITLKFRAFQQLWREDMRLLSVQKYRAKSQKKFEMSSRTVHNGYQKHRSSIRSRFLFPAGNLSAVPTTEIINYTSKLLSDSQVKVYRNTLKMPSLILDRRERTTSRFISSNGLVEDPCAAEKERAIVNPWTPEEKGIFMEKLTTFGKDFRKIASFLDHKTTADCVDFYYKNHKSDCFEKTKKPEFTKQSYLVTSGKRWDREINSLSLDMLGEASAIAAKADDVTDIQQRCTGKFLGLSKKYNAEGDEGMLERSSSIDIFGDERETAAADVLAGICGSLSSEAMSSCITSSFDPGQKVGSLRGRPLTPEVTQNVDDGTCSDDSCGEMDSADWTDEEKSIFVQAVSSYGKDFTMISRCVGTRSSDQCKVFFSKARKCLGLDTIHSGPVNAGPPVDHDANGDGSPSSVVCSDKSVSKMEEDMPCCDMNVNRVQSDPLEGMKLQICLNPSEENNGTEFQDCKDRPELQDCKDRPELGSENLVTDDHQMEAGPELDLDGECNMENGCDSKSMPTDAHASASLLSDKEAGCGEVTLCPLEESASVEEGNLNRSSTSGAVVENKDSHEISAEGPSSAERPRTELDECENNLHDKQDENINTKTSCQSGLSYSDLDYNKIGGTSSHLAADKDFSSDYPKLHHQIDLELDPTQKPHKIDLELDPTQKPHKFDLDFEKIRDERCQKSASLDDYHQHQSVHSLLETVDSSQFSRGNLLQVTTKKEMNGEINCNIPASLQCNLKLDRNYHSDRYSSQDCYIKKCTVSEAHSSGAEPELSWISQEQTGAHSESHSRSSSDGEKSCRNGDVKLFGQILTHPSSQQKPNSCIHENDDKGAPHPKLNGQSLNLKFTNGPSLDGNVVAPKLERNNNYLGLENLPMSYGFWDGNRIQTGFQSLPDSAILLAKYPAAFSTYQTAPSSKTEQHQLHPILKSNERNINGSTVFPTREISSSSTGLTVNQIMQPFALDSKQRPDIIFSEIQRCNNGFEAISGIQPPGRGMVGINVVGRGGILCTGVSDPVAAIKMHYAKTEQYGGQPGGIISMEDESWRGTGDIGR